ncbi:amidohydrolase [gamma proteobacterium BDW918]|jgi:hippurate hydrolase|uniref:Peptidase M20 n=1 Tax=Zhongshania aliphaticivorans TaxID=1470434 RepID=A0A127M3W9_9GAMM|nr:N(2)-acetyl-L-2,4-diaminobutanoate deacetylase DoeB2 [Zhongshania aliphaticivorans]AMO67916.1 peptidase M20 [Zhongshania aliphaticivorans]EIF44603.1 amidohydrolase [gamma proteobacterium BDW918]|tara:strand:+ start:87694 stop:88890 length:1197 start_codon:yes stop_codon:yes gene_type:complete
MSKYWLNTIAAAQTLRRDLHAHPEPSWQEVRTAETVQNTLSQLGIAWRKCAGTGTIATLQANSKIAKPHSKHIALRGDIDALPIIEQTGRDWSSTQSGCMHACGHDGHTATLLATARWLKHNEQSLTGPVTLLFQPAEEGGHGAREMINEGALDGIDEIYGWHNWPAIPFGKLVCPDDIVMCGNGTFTITVTGKGGHASQPELCRDPVLAASAITLALQQIVSRRLAPQQAAVVSVTSFMADSGATIIPQQAILGGSIRMPDQASRDQINALITEISQHTAHSYGVACEVEITPRYNATINHPKQAQHVRQLWQESNGSDSLHLNIRTPIMASEDFSYYLREIPGAFALIGADDGDAHHQVPCHSPHYDFNDRLIPLVTNLFSRLCGVTTPEKPAQTI